MFLGAALTRMHVQHRTLAERAEAREPTTITFQIDPLPEPLPPPDPKQAHADGKSPVDAPHDTVTPPLKPSRDVARAPTPNPKPSQDPRNVGITKAVHDLANGSGATARIFEGDDGVLTDKMARISDGAGGEDGDGVGDGIGAGKKMGFRDGGHGGPGERGPYHIGGGGPLVTGPVGKDGGPGIGHKTKRPIGDPTRAPPTTTAGCDKGDIAKNVRSRASSIRACYETQLLSRSDLSGKLTVQWTIGSDGGVREAHTTTDSVGSPAVTDCVLRAMRRLHFQAPEAGICVVSWPFAFTSGN
jgi:outer membrane biosynthesis protein TonB